MRLLLAVKTSSGGPAPAGGEAAAPDPRLVALAQAMGRQAARRLRRSGGFSTIEFAVCLMLISALGGAVLWLLGPGAR